MKSSSRLSCAALAVIAVSAGCSDREPPLAPSSNATSVASGTGALSSAIVATRAGIAVRDALDRVIPGLGPDDRADALHDAFDLVADALERGDRKLDRRVADAGTVLTSAAAQAPPHWLAELDVLRLALETAGSSR